MKEEEKQKLLQRGSELQSEHQQLEERDRQLTSAVKVSTGVGRGVPHYPHTEPSHQHRSTGPDVQGAALMWSMNT